MTVTNVMMQAVVREARLNESDGKAKGYERNQAMTFSTRHRACQASQEYIIARPGIPAPVTCYDENGNKNKIMYQPQIGSSPNRSVQ